MRFNDFYVSYKIRRKEIKNLIPWTKLPLYRKIFLTLCLSILILCIIFFIFKNFIATSITLVFLLILIITYSIINSTKSNLSIMLRKHYSPYSRERMNVIISLFNEYNLDLYDHVLIDLLIEETKKSQKEVDYIGAIEKELKILSTLIVPIIVFAAKKIGDIADISDTIVTVSWIIMIIITVYVFVISIWKSIKEFCRHDYNLHNDLISDLSQIKIFYSHKNSGNEFMSNTL